MLYDGLCLTFIKNENFISLLFDHSSDLSLDLPPVHSVTAFLLFQNLQLPDVLLDLIHYVLRVHYLVLVALILEAAIIIIFLLTLCFLDIFFKALPCHIGLQ